MSQTASHPLPSIPRPKHWFIAVVTPNTECACAEKILQLFNSESQPSLVETYVPVQSETHYWKSVKRKKVVNRVVCPCYVFVRCSEPRRKVIKSDSRAQFIHHFLKERALGDSHRRDSEFAIIPDQQMDVFRRMVEHANDLSIDPSQWVSGTRVRITEGPLMGEEGTLIHDYDGTSRLKIRINYLGYATMSISPDQVEVIP